MIGEDEIEETEDDTFTEDEEIVYPSIYDDADIRVINNNIKILDATKLTGDNLDNIAKESSEYYIENKVKNIDTTASSILTTSNSILTTANSISTSTSKILTATTNITTSSNSILEIQEDLKYRHFLDLPNLTYKTLSTGYEQKEQTTSRALSTLLSVSGAGYICFCANSATFNIKGTTCPVRYKLTVDGTVKLWLELTPCSSTTTLFRLMGYARQLDVISGYFNEDLLGLGVLVGSAQDSTTQTKQILDFSSSKQSFYALNNAAQSYGAVVAKFTKGLGIRFEKSFSFSANVGDWHVMYSLDD